MTFTDDDLIFSYSRKQAIADGVLVDVTELARDAGFRVPVAVNDSVWTLLEAIPDGSPEDRTGRLWDVLTVLASTIRAARDDESMTFFQVLMTQAPANRRKYVRLKAVFHCGDSGEPVFTIMLPTED